MASLSDEQVKALIATLNKADLQRLLRKAGIGVAATTNKEDLEWKVFVAIRLGLPVVVSR